MNLGITRNLTETGHSGIRIRKKNRKRSAKKRKKKKPKENQKEIGLVVLSALFFENQMGMPSLAWFCLRFGGDAKMSNEFTKIMSKMCAK